MIPRPWFSSPRPVSWILPASNLIPLTYWVNRSPKREGCGINSGSHQQYRKYGHHLGTKDITPSPKSTYSCFPLEILLISNFTMANNTYYNWQFPPDGHYGQYRPLAPRPGPVPSLPTFVADGPPPLPPFVADGPPSLPPFVTDGPAIPAIPAPRIRQVTSAPNLDPAILTLLV